jgi:hypothetical protein
VTGRVRNTVLLALILLAVAMTCWFLYFLFRSQPGEIAGALGGVIGGAIGAGGAGWSVYYTLTKQREDEIERTSCAILTEISVLTKYLIGHLDLCEMIQKGFSLPKDQIHTALLTPEPTLYRSVADKIARLPRPTQVVEFYTRMNEMAGIATLIANSPSEGPFITPNDIRGLADLLITQCQVAEAILSNTTPDPKSEAVLAQGLRSHMLAALRQQLAQAKQFFAESEAFH